MTGNISKAKGFKGDKGDIPSVKFELDNEGNLYYESDGILYDMVYLDKEGLATKEFVIEQIKELANKVAPSPASITLYEDRWQLDSEDGRWCQVVTVANATITPYSKVDLQLSAEQIAIFREKDLAFVAENEGGTVTVYCVGQVPEHDYVIQATISEAVV